MDEEDENDSILIKELRKISIDADQALEEHSIDDEKMSTMLEDDAVEYRAKYYEKYFELKDAARSARYALNAEVMTHYRNYYENKQIRI